MHVAPGLIFVCDPGKDAASSLFDLLLRRHALTDVHRRDPAGAFADAELGTRRQHQFGIDENVTWPNVSVGVLEELDVPVDAGVLDEGGLPAEHPVGVAMQNRAAVECV